MQGARATAWAVVWGGSGGAVPPRGRRAASGVSGERPGRGQAHGASRGPEASSERARVQGPEGKRGGLRTRPRGFLSPLPLSPPLASRVSGISWALPPTLPRTFCSAVVFAASKPFVPSSASFPGDRPSCFFVGIIIFLFLKVNIEIPSFCFLPCLCFFRFLIVFIFIFFHRFWSPSLM